MNTITRLIKVGSELKKVNLGEELARANASVLIQQKKLYSYKQKDQENYSKMQEELPKKYEKQENIIRAILTIEDIIKSNELEDKKISKKLTKE